MGSEVTDQLADHLTGTQIRRPLDAAFIATSALIICTAIIFTVVSPALEIKAEADLEKAREAAAL